LIKDRDLRRLPDVSREWIINGTTIGNATWHLVDLQSVDNKNKGPKPDEHH
jgi:hypothetical protein